jgi:hypothetical protein
MAITGEYRKIHHSVGGSHMALDVLQVLNRFEEEAKKLREKHRKHTMADPMILGYKPAAEIIERLVQKILDEIQDGPVIAPRPEPVMTKPNTTADEVSPDGHHVLTMREWAEMWRTKYGAY